jgi:hypothetical protein
VGSDGLIKTATTNLLSYSEEFNESVWTKHNLLAFGSGSTVNATTAPNGNLTADKITENTSNAQHMLYRNATPEAGKSYVLSFYAKAAERTFVIGGFSGGGLTSDCTVGVNLSTGDVASTSGSPELTQATAVGGGWYRIALVKTLPSTSVVQPRIIISTNGTSQGYTGDGTSGIYIWGAQLEQSSTVGEYIPTTSTINSAPRFDHNPTTGESLGLLVEEQRTNLLVQSNGFDTTWTNNNSSETSASGTAPDGTNTAWELKDTSDVSFQPHSINQSVSFTSGTTYTFTVWMKAGTLTEGGMAVPSAAFGAVLINRVNLSTGAVISTSANSTTVVTPFANGWYQIALTATATATASSSVQIRPMNGGTTYIGTGTGTVLIWGAQLEVGAFPTSYIPTTTATVTRSADVASISGTAFSSWYRQDEGTVFASARTNATHGGVNSFPRIYAISDGTNDNTIQNYYRVLTSYTDAGYSVAALTVAQAGFDTNNERNGQSLSTVYANNDFAFAINGSLVSTDNTGTVPTVSQLRLGARGTGLGPLNGTIRRLTYWPQRLSNSTLQQITQ